MKALGVDQLIHEYEVRCISACAPRHQALTIDTKGTRYGFRGED